jgi:hypothetical protein
MTQPNTVEDPGNHRFRRIALAAGIGRPQEVSTDSVEHA